MEYKKLEQLLSHPENEQLLPPLTNDEYSGLKKSLVEKFKEIPLEIMEQEKVQYTLLTGEYIVLDGNNRLKILREIGYNKPIPVIIHKYMEEAKQRTFIENAALNKRNLTKEAKIEIAQRQVARGISQAEVAKILGLSQQWVSEQTKEVKEVRKEIETQAVQLLRQAGVTQKETASIIGISKDTVIRTEKTSMQNTISGNLHTEPNIDKPTPEAAKTQVKAMLSEEEILEAAKKIRQEKTKSKIEERKTLIEKQNKMIESGELPELNGLFDIVVIDPPWPYGREYNPETSRVANPYPEMSIEEITKIKLPLKENSIIFLWTTHQFLPYAFEIAKSWETSYKATLVWDKQQIGMGVWFRMQCEFCLVLTKGNVSWWNNTTEKDIIFEKRREHSRKPESFYEMIDKLCNHCRRLDYFSRTKRSGWESFGNDIERF